MKTKRIEYILKNEKVFVGLEDSKKNWSLGVRSGRIVEVRVGSKFV